MSLGLCFLEQGPGFMKFADKIALLAKGKIEKITRPEDFFDEDLFKLVYGLQMSFDEKLMKIFCF